MAVPSPDGRFLAVAGFVEEWHMLHSAQGYAVHKDRTRLKSLQPDLVCCIEGCDTPSSDLQHAASAPVLSPSKSVPSV